MYNEIFMISTFFNVYTFIDFLQLVNNINIQYINVIVRLLYQFFFYHAKLRTNNKLSVKLFYLKTVSAKDAFTRISYIQ